jgi:hypothetical protein
MLNPARYQQTLDHQQQLLDEAARVRLLRGSAGEARETPADRRWRATCAAILRRVADRLEPVSRQSQVRA